MVLTELIGALGLGQQVMFSASILMVALYVWRAAMVARLVATLFSTLIGWVIMLFVVTAVAVAFGWVDLYPAAILDSLSKWLSAALRRLPKVLLL